MKIKHNTTNKYKSALIMLLLLRVYSLMFLFYNQVFSSLSLFSSFSSIQMYFIFLSRHLVLFSPCLFSHFWIFSHFILPHLSLSFSSFLIVSNYVFLFCLCIISSLHICYHSHFSSFCFISLLSLLCSALTVRLEY